MGDGHPRPLRVTSESEGVTPIETERRQNYQNDAQGFEAPLKSGTLHGRGVRDDQGFARPGNENVQEAPASSDESKTEKEVHFEEETNQEESVNQVNGASTGESKPRKRNKFMPWKKEKDQDSSDLEETDTEDSSKKTRKNPNITLWSQVRAVFGSWINLLLVFVPAGIALHFSGVNRVVVFVINFIAIIPLAGMLAYATEELALYIGEVLGGLLNASFGNAVELIVGVIALAQGKILIVKTSLIGSMLSNLLLVLGMCFFFGYVPRDLS